VTELVDRDGEHETQAEAPAEERPVEAEEGEEAEQEFELERGQQEGLGLEEKQRHGCEWAEALGPVGLALGFGGGACVDCRDAAVDSVGVGADGRQPLEHGGPGGAGLGPLLLLLLLQRELPELAQVLGVEDRLALGARQRALRQPQTALRTVMDRFRWGDGGCGSGCGAQERKPRALVYPFRRVLCFPRGCG
jgi:hypothetical protein